MRNSKYTNFNAFTTLLLLVCLMGLPIAINAAIANEKNPEKQVTAIRGVWLTNIASNALYSKKNITDAVTKCADLGFNTIFIVTYNGGYTLFPSEAAKTITGKKIHPDFAGRDPLKEVIKEAHKHNIKVFAWFEFGFASSHKDSTGGTIIRNKPEWASKDIHGNITEKNNFQWLNPFHPEVQEYMKNLIVEVVKNYDLDGIQGDDRLPALPSNGGYDEYTVNLYKSEHANKPPPAYEKDYEWIKWRSNKLTLFLKDIVTTLRAEDANIIISMAPSIYPWSEENYLQDWPTWLKLGLVDVMIPQVYRYKFEAYQREIDKIYKAQVSKENQFRVLPGVLLQVDDYNPSNEFLSKMIDYNRQIGVHGEVYFFYEGIKKFEDFFKSVYPTQSNFPKNLIQQKL